MDAMISREVRTFKMEWLAAYDRRHAADLNSPFPKLSTAGKSYHFGMPHFRRVMDGTDCRLLAGPELVKERIYQAYQQWVGAFEFMVL